MAAIGASPAHLNSASTTTCVGISGHDGPFPGTYPRYASCGFSFDFPETGYPAEPISKCWNRFRSEASLTPVEARQVIQDTNGLVTKKNSTKVWPFRRSHVDRMEEEVSHGGL